MTAPEASLAAGLLLVVALVLVGPVPRWLCRAPWTARLPRPALLLWQAVGWSAGFAAITAGLGFGVAPLGGSIPSALRLLGGEIAAGRATAGLSPVRLMSILVSTALAVWLVAMLVRATARTARDRHRHRVMVDLLCAPSADLGGARVLEHPGTVAYCLPGLRSRVVLSAGAVRALAPGELAAVLAHEHAHVAERHDLVVLPFVAWRAALPFLAGVRDAQPAVAGLVEMVADDRARAAAGAGHLASAIVRVGGASVPSGALAASGSSVLDRVNRLLDPRPAPWWGSALVYTAAVTVAVLPVVLSLASGMW